VDSTYLLPLDFTPRLVGSAVGFAIAGVLVVAAAVLDTFGGNPIFPTLVVPTILAGTLSGGVIGRRAADGTSQATSWSRFTIRFRLALLAVVIGAFVIASQWALAGYFSSDPNGSLARLLVGIPALALLGILGLGLPALLFTYPAATVWTWLLARLGPWR
jgi:hypothetical protein